MSKSPLAPCPTCGEEAARDARICPHCGGTINKSSAPFWIVLGVFAVAVVVGVVYAVHFAHNEGRKANRCAAEIATGQPQVDCDNSGP